MTNAFTLAKNHITVREAAEHYGLHPNRAGMIRCLFHPDRNPSMKIDRRYYCFGCQATGDVIDFTAKLFDLSPKEAAEKLIADFHLDPDKPPAALNPNNVRTDAQKLRDAERLCISVLSEYYRRLEEWKKTYAPQTPDEPFHDRFVEACHKLEYVDYLLNMLCCGEPHERQQVIDEWLVGNKIHTLQERMRIIKKEEMNERNEHRNYGIAG